MRRTAFFLVSILAFGWTALADDAPADRPPTTAPYTPPNKVLAYHDGRSKGKRSIGGSGQMIQFTMPDGYTRLVSISVLCARYGSAQTPDADATLTILDEGHTTTLYSLTVPGRAFVRGAERWVTMKLPNPPQITGKFWVCIDFHAEQTSGVYVCYDTNTGGRYSMVGSPTVEPKPVDFKGDWMIQVMVGRK